jgi:hypothetical protein
MRLARLFPVAFIYITAMPALADIPEIVACADQADAKLRLACFDAAVVKLKTDVAEAEARKKSLFGFSLPSLGLSGGDSTPEPVLGPKDAVQVTAKVTGAIKDSSGHVIMTLDNGQVWKVQDEGLVPVNAAKTVGIVINENMTGGYYLSIIGQTNNLSVMRVR